MPWKIALLGQSGSQMSQLMHSWVIFSDILTLRRSGAADLTCPCPCPCGQSVPSASGSLPWGRASSLARRGWSVHAQEKMTDDHTVATEPARWCRDRGTDRDS